MPFARLLCPADGVFSYRFGHSFSNVFGLSSVGWKPSFRHVQVFRPNLDINIDIPCQFHRWRDYHLLDK